MDEERAIYLYNAMCNFIRYCNFVGLSYKLEGYGKVVSQSIKANTIVDKSMTLEINLTV